MATLDERNSSSKRVQLRCRECGSDVRPAASCPACGAPAGPGLPTAVAGSGPLSRAEAARLQSRAHIPDELRRAWDQPPEQRPASAARTEEVLGHRQSAAHAKAHRKARHGRALLVVAAAVVVVAGGVAILVTRTTTQHQQASLTPPTLTPTTRAPAQSLPFVAAFPSTPSTTQTRLTLDKVPYTATLYSAVGGGSAVTVGVFPFPLGRYGRFDARAFLTSVVERGDLGTHARLRVSGVTTVQGLPATWVASTAGGGTSAVFGVVVLDGHIAYELLASGPATTVTATFHHVLDGFKIISPSSGVAAY